MNSKDRPSYRWLLWGLALLGAALDQGTKYGVFHWLYNNGEGGQHVVIRDTFELLAQYGAESPPSAQLLAPLRTGERMPRVNHGALFGLGGEHQHLANMLFAVISVVAAGAIAYWSLRRSTARDKPLCAALGLILAGTLGNLYDRVVFHGVRDFLHWHYKEFEWPVFNLADCCLVCGAFLLLAQALWSRSAAKPARLSTTNGAALSPEMAEAN